MTHPQYTQQALCCYTLPRLKRIATDLGVSPKGNKTQRQTWINAIISHQSAQLQNVDEQTTAPEPLTTVEISFYDHEIYSGNHLIASITHDDDLTQPWVVMVDGKEKYRAKTWARCHRFIQWHLNNSQLPSRNSQLNTIPKSKEFGSLMEQSPHRIDNCELRTANCELLQDSTLNESTQVETPCTTENRIMAHIFNECQKYGFEILNDGIYQNDVKLGQVGCTDGNWWVINPLLSLP
ncbi:hypothetical protein LC593_32240 [Nostoc sp. CHAB 5844]|nr:hypothetical protein [Nostoc sp. CHAB 5844]